MLIYVKTIHVVICKSSKIVRLPKSVSKCKDFSLADNFVDFSY